MAVVGTPITSGDAVGRYSNLASLQRWQGDNVATTSDINNDDALNSARVQAAFDATDAEITFQLTARGFSPVGADTFALQKLEDISNRLAIAWMHEARDNRDAADPSDPSGGSWKVASWKKHAKIDLKNLCLYGTGLTRIVTTAVGYPTAVE